MAQHFSTAAEGIGGQIKRRYTDFVVEEIRPGGRVCDAKRFTDKGTHMEEPVDVPEKPDGAQFLHFDLEKINKDTSLAVSKISRFLRCSRKRVGYAGMKDKRAVSCQRISLFEPDLERLRQFGSEGMQLRNPEWSAERIEIGNLKANGFTVKIRDISLPEDELRRRIEGCFAEMNGGIANYFGEQRFGGVRNITHAVGREFVRGNTKQAVMLYLTHVDEREEEEIRNARKRLAETGDFPEATRLFPVKFRYERAILHHLCRCPNDFAGAFGKLPKQIRYLFTHAYQSHLFNRAIDMRFEHGIGLKIVKGDILIENNPSAPLFGFESVLAEGVPGEIERAVLQEEGLELQQFKVRQMAELSSKGARKSIVLLPRDLRLVGIEEDEFFGGKLAASVSFSLEKGAYATTVLRELMKGGPA